jgi:hypothetical protein
MDVHLCVYKYVFMYVYIYVYICMMEKEWGKKK